MTVLALMGVVLVLFAAAAVATRGGGALADAPQDLPDLALPDGPLGPADLAGLRFSMAPRGYRMSEVDAVLDRLADELADRDRRLAELGPRPPAADAEPDQGPAAQPDEAPGEVPHAVPGHGRADSDGTSATAARTGSGGDRPS